MPVSSKWYLNCPFSPGIEEHAGIGEIPSFEGSTVFFFARMKHVVHVHLLNR